jgi:hypothetical protein
MPYGYSITKIHISPECGDGEQSMLRVRHVLAVAGAAAVVAGIVIPAAQAATHKVTIKIVGISRTGMQVAVQSIVVPISGNALPSTGPTYSGTGAHQEDPEAPRIRLASRAAVAA